MDYIKIHFGTGLVKFHSEMERAIDDLFRSVNPMFRLSADTWKPQMDIYETSEEITIICETSGVAAEDMVVELDSRAVKISGRRTESRESRKCAFILRRFPMEPLSAWCFCPRPLTPRG